MTNEERSKDLIWSCERWFLTVTVIFAVQVVVVFWLSARQSTSFGTDTGDFQTYYQPPVLTDSVNTLLQLLDPSLFARARTVGFSGDIWMKQKPVAHSSQGWTEEPHFLRFDEEQLLGDLAEFGQGANSGKRPISAVEVRKGEAPRPMDGSLKPMPRSVISVAPLDGLNKEDLLQSPEVPTVQFDGILSPTRVEVLVDRRGRVFSARLTGRSGSDVADQKAIKLTRELRFRQDDGFAPNTDPSEFSSFRSAAVDFLWWTTAPSLSPPTSTEEQRGVENPDIIQPTTVDAIQ
jgi:hypothetical protein